jgi:hypothetical protein
MINWLLAYLMTHFKWTSYTVQNDRVTVSDEYYIMWKETEMAHFKEVPGPTEGK